MAAVQQGALAPGPDVTNKQISLIYWFYNCGVSSFLARQYISKYLLYQKVVLERII
jgi:hypothetical protein